MMKVCAPLFGCVALAVSSFAQQPLMPFGNEPSWRVDLTTPGVAKAYRGGAGGQGGAAASASALEAHGWRLQSLPGRDAKALAARPPLTLRFEAGRVSGFSGCNRLVGSYAVENDTVTLSQVGGTMMACPEPAMALERAFRAALGGPLRYSIAGDRLTLKPASGEPLVFVAEVQVLDGSWQVNGFNNGRDAVIGLKGDVPITLTFKAGALTGDAGCNSFRGAYVVDGKGVKFGTLAASRKACAEDVMKQEREFLAAIESAVTWVVEGDTLDMHRADGQRAVMAIRK